MDFLYEYIKKSNKEMEKLGCTFINYSFEDCAQVAIVIKETIQEESAILEIDLPKLNDLTDYDNKLKQACEVCGLPYRPNGPADRFSFYKNFYPKWFVVETRW